MARLFHIALAEDWERALGEGSYRVSTRGRSLAETGFIHLCFADQVTGVTAAFYADLSDLVLLELDPDRLVAEVRVESVTDSTEAFPHLYGEITPDMVIAVAPWGVGSAGPAGAGR